MNLKDLKKKSPAELVAMADAIGLRGAWLHRDPVPHFDVCQAKRQQAIARVWIARMRAIIAGPKWKQQELPLEPKKEQRS